MTTTLEIIDSAVKIGIGALISGVTAYWASVAKSKNELKKSLQDDRRDLLRQIAIEVGKSDDSISEYMHITHIPDHSLIPIQLAEKRNLLLQSIKHSNTATSLASLVSHEDLFLKLRAYAESVDEIHSTFAAISPDDDFDYSAAFDGVEKHNMRLAQVQSALASAFSSTTH